MYKKGLPIRVNAILFSRAFSTDKTIKFLIAKRSPEDGGFWQTITGTLEDGESRKNCLLREVHEELGLDLYSSKIEILEDIYEFTWNKGEQVITEYVYGLYIPDELFEKQKVLLSEEHINYGWYEYGQAIEILGKDNNKEALKRLNNRLQGGF